MCVTPESEPLKVWIYGRQYDLSQFVHQHPGGKEILQLVSAGDASHMFKEAMHSPEAKKQMEKYEIKNPVEPAPKPWKNSKESLNPEDLKNVRKESIINWNFSGVGWVNDLRDRKILDLLFELFCIALPLIALIITQCESNLVCFAAVATFAALYTGRYILFLHYTSHRKAFKSPALEFMAHHILGMFFGLPPFCYHTHHVIMHHQENNIMPYDLSSTMPYKRDNFLHFLHYYLRFQFGIYIELPYYCYKKNRLDIAAKLLGGIVLYGSLIFGVILPAYPVGGFWFFVFPWFFVSFMLMFGNFSQHLFVDPKRWDSNYGLSFNSIECVANSMTFNDGYHVLHHIHPTLHWTTLPKVFDEYQDRFDKMNMLNVKGMDFFLVGLLVMFHRYDYLASKSNKTADELRAMTFPFKRDANNNIIAPKLKST